jgi:NitT/TauT family transport system substrate-binding protein
MGDRSARASPGRHVRSATPCRHRGSVRDVGLRVRNLGNVDVVKRLRELPRLAVAAFAAVAMAAGAAHAQMPGVPQSGAPQKLVLGLSADVALTEAPVVLARNLGFFAAEGIDLQVTAFRGSANLLAQLTAKRVQVGLLKPRALLGARQSVGNAVPVRFFYNLVRAATHELVVPNASPIRRLEDLKERKVGVGALTFNHLPLLRAVLAEAGLKPVPADAGPKPGGNVTLVAVGIGAPAFRALAEGRADALDIFDIQRPLLEESGAVLRRLELPLPYQDLPEDGFAAHPDTIAREPGTLAGFGRAVAKGTIACAANRPACVAAFWRAYPDRAPAPGTKGAALDDAVRQLDARLARLLAFPADEPSGRYGAYPPNAWRDLIEAWHKAGLLPSADVPPETLYTDGLVEAFNSIAPEVVARAARALP